MNRREFMAAAAASGLLPSRAAAAKPFPIHYARSSPYESLVGYVAPGSDEFTGEKAAIELEASLSRKFAGQGQSRFYALPDFKVRFEIASGNEYRTGLWQLPGYKVLQEDAVSSPKPY